MPESIQHKLLRVRPPRVMITYDVEIGDAIQMKELPFVVGILSDLSGMRKPDAPLPPLKHRKFVEIDRDNFNEVMASMEPFLDISVIDQVSEGFEGLVKRREAAEAGTEPAPGKNIKAVLSFNTLDDFLPQRFINQIPELSDLFGQRTRLNDLIAKVDGNDALDNKLREVVGGDLLAKLKTEADALKAHAESENPEGDPPASPEIDAVIEAGRMARDDTQKPGARNVLSEFATQQSAGSLKLTADTIDTIGVIEDRIAEIDELLSVQLDEILHDPAFQELESRWRGLSYLVKNSETSSRLKLRLMNVQQKELLKDLESAAEFDQSALFKKVYEEEYGTFGGNPYSMLIGDYYFGRHPQDMALLAKLAEVAAAAHAPFVSAADPKLFDMDSFTDLSNPRDLEKIFESTELIKWRSFRASEDSRYVSLVLPRVLLRLPYGPDTVPVEEFAFKEDTDGKDHSKYLWGNAAYALAQRATNAFALYGWTAAIRGVEGGGLVEGLPTHTFKTDDGDIALKCPTEIAITDRREYELSKMGFIALVHEKGNDQAAFFGGQTTQKPMVYDTDQANANAALSARLPYILAAARFAHYLKVICRDKVGSFLTGEDVSRYLNRWIGNYVLGKDDAGQSLKARYPLREARIDVTDVPGNPGAYMAVVFLRPHFQLEELTASIRLVAELPPPAAA